MTKILVKCTPGEVVHYNSDTWVAAAVEDDTNRLLKFKCYHFYSGWPVREPRRGDKISIRWNLYGEFLSARLVVDD